MIQPNAFKAELYERDRADRYDALMREETNFENLVRIDLLLHGRTRLLNELRNREGIVKRATTTPETRASQLRSIETIRKVLGLDAPTETVSGQTFGKPPGKP